VSLGDSCVLGSATQASGNRFVRSRYPSVAESTRSFFSFAEATALACWAWICTTRVACDWIASTNAGQKLHDSTATSTGSAQRVM
jgi:hypothetical protein